MANLDSICCLQAE